MIVILIFVNFATQKCYRKSGRNSVLLERVFFNQITNYCKYLKTGRIFQAHCQQVVGRTLVVRVVFTIELQSMMYFDVFEPFRTFPFPLSSD